MVGLWKEIKLHKIPFMAKSIAIHGQNVPFYSNDPLTAWPFSQIHTHGP